MSIRTYRDEGIARICGGGILKGTPNSKYNSRRGAGQISSSTRNEIASLRSFAPTARRLNTPGNPYFPGAMLQQTTGTGMAAPDTEIPKRLHELCRLKSGGHKSGRLISGKGRVRFAIKMEYAIP